MAEARTGVKKGEKHGLGEGKRKGKGILSPLRQMGGMRANGKTQGKRKLLLEGSAA